MWCLAGILVSQKSADRARIADDTVGRFKSVRVLDVLSHFWFGGDPS